MTEKIYLKSWRKSNSIVCQLTQRAVCFFALDNAIIKEQPTADVVEVVYCKNCKYNDKGVCINPDNITHSYDSEDNVYDHYISVYSNHFCGCGERRDA